MKVTILSGGSGNDSLVRGLKELYPEVNINVIINAYDDGKSTGVCREITNTLGVSDVRKNHIRMYKIQNMFPDKRLIEFYDDRYDLPISGAKDFVAHKLNQWGLSSLITWSDRFFDTIQSDAKYRFDSFNIANICYSIMYKYLGYDATNEFFCNLLNIDNFVLFNSYDNVRLKARTTNGILATEADIVEYNKIDSPIMSLVYDHNTSEDILLNSKAIDVVKASDLIIISSGTFWSSIYPTLEYGDFYKFINDSKAKKMWIMNNEQDKDALGVGSNEFINILSKLGLNLSDFCIVENESACELLRQENLQYNIHRPRLGNHSGKHDSFSLGHFVFRYYYNILSEYDNILIDFDDTIWSRDSDNNNELLFISLDNLRRINHPNITLISGNNYDHIKDKIYRVFGTKHPEIFFDVWCDANAVSYDNEDEKTHIESLLIRDSHNKVSTYIKDKFNISCSLNNAKFPSCLKIRPLDKITRDILHKSLNSYIFNDLGITDLEARKTGRTTIDIVKKNNNKSKVYDALKLLGKKTLYIGDECFIGNDKEIALKCSSFVNVKSVYETNLILRLL